MYENRIKHLEESHRVLDKQINQLLSSGQFDDIKIQEMKKQKLQLRDEIRRLNRLQWDHDHESVHFDE